MQLSCGVVLLDVNNRMFLVRATGTERWDIPKGLPDPGEVPLETALREAKEEAGIDASQWPLVDLGEQDYLTGKHLHLFAGRIESSLLDPAKCRCTSFFEHHRTKELLPEADAFAWVEWDAWPGRVGKGLRKTLQRLGEHLLAL
ncbi:NUDIX hydrolase [Roseateles sp. So40a]|uniref:NUDIX hydrolase n=1 Tax=Roseateles sp. So40a TaxID=3400226 RepID=UPI003A871CE1